MSKLHHKLQNISVLVSIGRHPVSGAARYCKNDALSLTLGLKLAESASANINVLSASNTDNGDSSALSDYLALGAELIQVIVTDAGEDIIPSLVANLNTDKPDLILAGSRAENGEDSGLLPYLLAEKLSLPLIANVLEITPVDDSLEVLQFLPKGKRRRVVISLPAMVVVHPLAPALLHFAPARRVTGKITWLPSSNVNSSLRQSPNKLHKKILAYRPSKDTRPTKLKVLGGQYSTKKTGHERLMDAITTEAKGGTVVIDKSSVEKAQVILSYLREHHLIDF